MSLSFPRLWTGSASDSCAAEGTTLALAFDSPSGLGEPPSSPSPCLRPLLADHVGFFAAPCVRVMARSITRDFFFFFQSLRFIDFEMAFGRSLLPSLLFGVSQLFVIFTVGCKIYIRNTVSRSLLVSLSLVILIISMLIKIMMSDM